MVIEFQSTPAAVVVDQVDGSAAESTMDRRTGGATSVTDRPSADSSGRSEATTCSVTGAVSQVAAVAPALRAKRWLAGSPAEVGVGPSLRSSATSNGERISPATSF